MQYRFLQFTPRRADSHRYDSKTKELKRLIYIHTYLVKLSETIPKQS
jgi:hypothetical protein